MNNRLKQKLIKIRRRIHEFPELGNHEFKTSDFIEKTLKGLKIKTYRISKTGVVGLLKGEKPGSGGKCMALRADIDALPIQEKTNKKYKSKRKGIMHACGHDANTTIVLGSAILLSEKRKHLSGSVKFIFQPNEESSEGATNLIKGGVLKKPQVNAIVGVHVCPWLSSGTLGLKRGAMMAATDKFTIEILGEGGHGAYPHMGKDAIVISSQVINSLQTLVSREIDPVEPVVISVGTIEGGERFNVLCNKVKMTGTVRTLGKNLHSRIPGLIEKKISSIARAYGASYKLDYEVLGYPLRNSDNILKLCYDAGVDFLGKSRVKLLEKPSMGGEDFAEYLRYVPGCFIYIGTGKGKVYPWHHERFDIDENALPKGAGLLLRIAEKFLHS